MRVGVSKKTNAYSQAVDYYARTPKAVWAAIAYSFALRLGEEDHGTACVLINQEWRALHASGIVPQVPPEVPPA